jgi:hypothetical protein
MHHPSVLISGYMGAALDQRSTTCSKILLSEAVSFLNRHRVIVIYPDRRLDEMIQWYTDLQRSQRHVDPQISSQSLMPYGVCIRVVSKQTNK